MPFVEQLQLEPRGTPPIFSRAGVECEGRTFGSWIGSRNGHAQGDLIDQVAYIIESILRDELNVSGANIDTASFDAVPAVTGKLFLSHDYSVASRNLIEMLAFQAGYMLVVSAGKYRLVDVIAAGDKTSSGILLYSDLAEPPTVTTTDVNRVVNHLTINHSFAPEYRGFLKSTVFQNTASQAKPWGIRKAAIDCPNVSDAQVTALGNALVPSSGTGLWSSPRTLVDFVTIGWKWAHIEVGDYINADATTFDAQGKLFGGSWADSSVTGAGDFLVLEKMISAETVTFKTIEAVI